MIVLISATFWACNQTVSKYFKGTNVESPTLVRYFCIGNVIVSGLLMIYLEKD